MNQNIKRMWTAQPKVFKALFPAWIIGVGLISYMLVNSGVFQKPLEHVFELIFSLGFFGLAPIVFLYNLYKGLK